MAAIQSYGVVPDVIDVAPPQPVHVSYDTGVNVDYGNELTPTRVQNEPLKVEWSANNQTSYTLCMIDPDAPSRANPTLAQVLHWLIVNIQGKAIKTGEVFAEYIGSGAPKGTGLHRYVFLVYKQPGPINCDEPRISNRSREGRIGFSVRALQQSTIWGSPLLGISSKLSMTITSRSFMNNYQDNLVVTETTLMLYTKALNSCCI